MNTKKSIITLLGIPEAFGSVLLSLTLILALAPYLAGADFGIFKIPDLNTQSKQTLKWLGPVFVLGSILLFVPLLDPKANFSIVRPNNNDELPLGEDLSWMLEGKFPITDENQDTKGTPNITVEVYRMPGREPIPQNGKPRISTAQGLWHFESAKFAGSGDYEIVVEASLNGWRDFRSISVKCLQKGEAYQQAIIRDREYRNASSLVLATPEDISLPQLYQDLYQLQNQFFEFYPGNLDSALKVVFKTLDILDPVLPIFPNDVYLQNTRAYTFKNYAMVMRDLNRPEEFDRTLKESERMFEVIRQQNPEDAGAWNGLGSIALLRNDPKTALEYIDKALEIMPNYEAAIHDREIALRMLKEQGNHHSEP